MAYLLFYLPIFIALSFHFIFVNSKYIYMNNKQDIQYTFGSLPVVLEQREVCGNKPHQELAHWHDMLELIQECQSRCGFGSLHETVNGSRITKYRRMNTKSREYQAAKSLEDSINDMSWNEKEFAKACCTFHRTLQQTLFRTLVAVLREYADPNRSVDPRNEASKDGSRKLLEVIDTLYIPFI